MADLTVNMILRLQDETAAAFRKVQANVQATNRAMSGQGRGRKPKGFFGLQGASLNETAGALEQLGGAAKSAVGTPIALAANFEAALNRVNALSGGKLGAEGKLEAISDKARELGRSTEFTATQAADGFAVLTQAGFTYEQQLASIGTVLDLATVAQIDMEDAANLTANALGGFGLKAEEAARVGDVLARASNASQISIRDLGESFKYAAPGASNLGFQIEDVGTAIAILGKSGLKGSMGGTALRAFFGRLSMLVDPKFATDKQEMAAKRLGLDRKSLKAAIDSGDLQNIATYMAQAISKSKLSKSGKNAALQAIFQERGALGAAILMRAAEMPPEAEGSWADLERQVNDTAVSLGSSAKIMRSGTKASAKELMGALEDLGITVGEKLLPVITPLIKDATDAAVSFAKWADKNKPLVQMMGKALLITAALGTTLGPLLLTLGSIRTLLGLVAGPAGFGGYAAGASKAKVAQLGFNAATAQGIIAAALIGVAIGSALDEYFKLSDQIAGVNKAAGVTAEGEVGGSIRGSAVMGSDLTDAERMKLQAAQQWQDAAKRELEDTAFINKGTFIERAREEELENATRNLAQVQNQIAARQKKGTVAGLRAAETMGQTPAFVGIHTKKQEAATIAGAGEKGAAVTIDPSAKIRIINEAGKPPQVIVDEEADVPLSVENGLVGGM